MQINTIHTIYFSPVFHTRSLAQTLGAILARQCQVQAINEKDITVGALADPPRIAPTDLVILACPLYGGRIPGLASRRLAAITGSGAPAIMLVSYGNRAWEDALVELQDVAVASGLRPLAAAACVAAHTIVPDIAQGRPDKADLQSLAQFAAAVAQRLVSLPDGQIPPLAVPGHRPYRDYRPAPLPQTVNDNCTLCGLCASECPAGAIDAVDVTRINQDRCISCMRCINICPARARVPAAKFIEAVRLKIGPACAEPKQNAYFGI